MASQGHTNDKHLRDGTQQYLSTVKFNAPAMPGLAGKYVLQTKFHNVPAIQGQ